MLYAPSATYSLPRPVRFSNSEASPPSHSHPCRLFASLYYWPSCGDFCGIHPHECISLRSSMLSDPFTYEWTGYVGDKLDKNAESFAEWQINTIDSNLHMFVSIVGTGTRLTSFWYSGQINIGMHSVLQRATDIWRHPKNFTPLEMKACWLRFKYGAKFFPTLLYIHIFPRLSIVSFPLSHVSFSK